MKLNTAVLALAASSSTTMNHAPIISASASPLRKLTKKMNCRHKSSKSNAEIPQVVASKCGETFVGPIVVTLPSGGLNCPADSDTKDGKIASVITLIGEDAILDCNQGTITQDGIVNEDFSEPYMNGIELNCGASVRNCKVTNFYVGVLVNSGGKVEDSVFTGNDAGAEIDSSYPASIIRSTFDGNNWGIFVTQSDPNQAGNIEIQDASASYNSFTGTFVRSRGVSLSLENVAAVENDFIEKRRGGIYIISEGGDVHIDRAHVRENGEQGLILWGTEGASFTVNNTNSTDNGSIGIHLYNNEGDAKFDVDLTDSVNNTSSSGITINCNNCSTSLKDVEVTDNKDGMFVYLRREDHAVDLSLDGEIVANNNTRRGIIVAGRSAEERIPSADIYINGHVTTNSNLEVGFQVKNNTEANLFLSSGASFKACYNPVDIDIEKLGSGKFLAESYPFPSLTCDVCPLEPTVGITEKTVKMDDEESNDFQKDLELEMESGTVRGKSRGGSTTTPPGLFN